MTILEKDRQTNKVLTNQKDNKLDIKSDEQTNIPSTNISGVSTELVMIRQFEIYSGKQ